MKKFLYLVLALFFWYILSIYTFFDLSPQNSNLPLMETIIVSPLKWVYKYGDQITFRVIEYNPYPMIYTKVFSNTCTEIRLYWSYEPMFQYSLFWGWQICWAAFTYQKILPFWAKSYEIKKILVPYTQNLSDHYFWGLFLPVWPGVNIITGWSKDIKINLPKDPIEEIVKDCLYYEDEKLQKSCFLKNPKNISDCDTNSGKDNSFYDYDKDTCIKILNQKK